MSKDTTRLLHSNDIALAIVLYFCKIAVYFGTCVKPQQCSCSGSFQGERCHLQVPDETSAIPCDHKGTNMTKNSKQIWKNNCGPILILVSWILTIFIGLMGWIWIGFSLLLTFANCVLYRFFEILTFLGNLY